MINLLVCDDASVLFDIKTFKSQLKHESLFQKREIYHLNNNMDHFYQYIVGVQQDSWPLK